MEQFNASLYLAINNDLRMTKYGNPNTAKFHFTNYGFTEGRPFMMKELYNDFRPEYYNALNMDLQKYKMKPVDLAIHYLTKGRFEKRMYKPEREYDLIYLYTDNLNYSRAEYYENLLKSIDVPCKIVTDGILNSNCLYILFTHRQIKLYPFYYLLCLDNYDIPQIIMDLSIGLIVDKLETIEKLRPLTNKIYLGNDIDSLIENSNREKLDDSYLLKRILLGAEHCKLEMNYVLDKEKIYSITQLENTYRYNKFINQRHKPDNLETLVGLKHPIGWIGCGMSYKSIMDSAIKQDLPYITICNDDVVFKDDFSAKYNKIIEYLNKNNNWDIFTGIVNITDPYIKVLNKIKIEDGLELLQIDMFDSLAFNIYRKSMFENIKLWDTKYRMFPEDKLVNHMRKQNRLVILTVNPFLVEYNYDVNSTVSRNKKNELEFNKIRICENNICNKKMLIR